MNIRKIGSLAASNHATKAVLLTCCKASVSQKRTSKDVSNGVSSFIIVFYIVAAFFLTLALTKVEFSILAFRRSRKPP